jgi:alkanesulfonate monooxygenase SsuD/methylene tetrahydromethanopterin reductase-like flavin-dependent oxidoreductase (luciferase family)
MGMVLPLYQPWRVLEEIGMLDHLTGGRLEIGCASGVPQELAQIGIAAEENRERFPRLYRSSTPGLQSP